MVAPGLKTRYIDVYLPTEAAKHEWEEEAKKAGLSLSKFIFAAVEAFRALKDEPPRYEMVKELAEAKEEAQKLRAELKMKTMLLEKLDADVYRGFLFTTFEAVFLRIALFNYDYDIHFPLNRSYF